MLYLDHAATSFPKPSAVLDAITAWYRDLGVSADRGDSARCTAVRREVQATRALLGTLVGMPAERIAFTSGATEALNLALRALLRPGDAVLTTAFEHSSVVRPLRALVAERALALHVLPATAAGGLDLAAARTTLQTLRPRLFVFTHASNVTGAGFDAAELCAAARAAGALTLLDASQTAGLLPLAVGADLVAASAHKALLGPPGLGFLAARPGLELPLQKQGGTGSSLALAEHPTTWPTAFEAGTPNTPAILGLGSALRWLTAEVAARRHAAALAHTDELAARLGADPDVRLLRPPPGPRVPILSFVHRRYDPAELGAMFDAAGVHVRTGFHCAPWLHPFLDTATAGTVRLSPGPELSAADVRAVAAVVVGS
jgi:selenocysteine lyase/cysteine desulfurase